MAIRDFNFRPNPGRAVYIIGDFNDTLLSRAVPEINRLRFENAEPITVFINSLGGFTRSLDVLIGCLWDGDLEAHDCRIITVATGDSASSAATLLALGDYTIAYPRSEIHFHGVRIGEREVTTESASECALVLAEKNLQIAFKLADTMIRKVGHRFSLACEEFSKIREAEGETLTELDCFVRLISNRVGERAAEIVNGAYLKTTTALTLHTTVLPKAQFADCSTALEQDVAVFKAVVEHEIATINEKGWRLDEKGCSQIMSDYLLLRDYAIGKHQSSLEWVARQVGISFLNSAEFAEFIRRNEQSQKDALEWRINTVIPRVRPFWYFTVRLCQQLQEGENRLSPRDAYWLGVVDEVYGTPLQGFRAVMEAEPAVSA